MLTHTIILDMAGLSPTRHFTLTVKHFLENISRIDQVRQQTAAIDSCRLSYDLPYACSSHTKRVCSA